MNFSLNRKILFISVGIFAGIMLLLAGMLWLHRPVQHVGRTDVSPFENDMMESLVRGILHESGIINAPVCFLSFGEGRTSPSATFMERFTDCRQPAVQIVGNSVSSPIRRFFEKSNGHSGTVIQIISFHEYIPGVFDITVTISSLPRGHNQVVYRLADLGGNWVIQKRTPS